MTAAVRFPGRVPRGAPAQEVPVPVFSAELELHGTSATGLRVPPEELDALGGGRRPAVRVTLRGHTYRTTVGVRGGVALVPVSAEQRAAAGVRAGEVLDVQLELDTEPRVVELPAALAQALERDPEAARRFAALSPGNRKRHALAVSSAKAEATRDRRLAAVLSELA